jgi:hypothetical protein
MGGTNNGTIQNNRSQLGACEQRLPSQQREHSKSLGMYILTPPTQSEVAEIRSGDMNMMAVQTPVTGRSKGLVDVTRGYPHEMLASDISQAFLDDHHCTPWIMTPKTSVVAYIEHSLLWFVWHLVLCACIRYQLLIET